MSKKNLQKFRLLLNNHQWTHSIQLNLNLKNEIFSIKLFYYKGKTNFIFGRMNKTEISNNTKFLALLISRQRLDYHCDILNEYQEKFFISETLIHLEFPVIELSKSEIEFVLNTFQSFYMIERFLFPA